jgi:hypothetical protein
MQGRVRSLMFGNARGRKGLELKTRNRAIVAQFWAAFGLQDAEGVLCGYDPPLLW